MGSNSLLCYFLIIAILNTCYAPPVTQNKKENAEQHPDSDFGGLEDYMEYYRYLKEVVSTLEADPEFRQKLEKADESEIKSGKIAEELQFVSHHIRTRLDEIKRVELQRLKELVEKKRKLEDSNSIDEDPTHHHLDQSNPHTFEIEDLKKLISKTTEDLAEADKIRKEEFKRYEMEKEFQKQEKLNHTNGEERNKLEQEYQNLESKHKKHQKLHEPGHKAQLEAVWEEQDQMQQDFDPKTFFMLHDIDGNGLWDQEEVKALFIKELDKMYQQGAPEDDMRERAEEMERMRESVFAQMDVNRDGFIDYLEFLKQTKTNDFEQDHGWQSLDEQTRPYSDEELAEYIRQHHGMNQVPQYDHIPQHIPPGAYQQLPPGAQHQIPPGGYQQVHPNQQFYPGQVPQMPPQHLDLNTNEIHQGQPQPPQYQHVPQQVPQHVQQQMNQQPPQQANQQLPQQANQQVPQQQVLQQKQNIPQQVNPQILQQQMPQQQQVPQMQTQYQQNIPQQNQPHYHEQRIVNNQYPDSPKYQQPNVGNNQQNQPSNVPQQNGNPRQPNLNNQQPNVQYNQVNSPQQQQQLHQQPVVQQTK